MSSKVSSRQFQRCRYNTDYESDGMLPFVNLLLEKEEFG